MLPLKRSIGALFIVLAGCACAAVLAQEYPTDYGYSGCSSKSKYPLFSQRWMCRQNRNSVRCQKRKETNPNANCIVLPKLFNISEASDPANTCEGCTPPSLANIGKTAVQAQTVAEDNVFQEKTTQATQIYDTERAKCSDPVYVQSKKPVSEGGECVAACNPTCICQDPPIDDCIRTIRYEVFYDQTPTNTYFQEDYYNKFAGEYVLQLATQYNNYGLPPEDVTKSCEELYGAAACTATSPANGRRRRRLRQMKPWRRLADRV